MNRSLRNVLRIHFTPKKNPIILPLTGAFDPSITLFLSCSSDEVIKSMWPEGKQLVTEVSGNILSVSPLQDLCGHADSVVFIVDAMGCKVIKQKSSVSCAEWTAVFQQQPKCTTKSETRLATGVLKQDPDLNGTICNMCQFSGVSSFFKKTT